MKIYYQYSNEKVLKPVLLEESSSRMELFGDRYPFFLFRISLYHLLQKINEINYIINCQK